MPPPGFGPKIDKKQKEAEAQIIPASERYSIRLEAKEEEVLRHVLRAAQEFAGPSDQRLLRDQKKLHQLYGQLMRAGFSAESVEACLPHMRANATLPDALDWCCLHLPEASLPSAFKLSRIGEGANDAESSETAPSKHAAALAAEAAKAAKAAAPRVTNTKAAAAYAAREAAAAKAKAEKRQQQQQAGEGNGTFDNKRFVAAMMEGGSSEEENELTDALGVLELEEVDVMPTFAPMLTLALTPASTPLLTLACATVGPSPGGAETE